MARVELDLRTRITNLQKGLAKTEKGLKGLQNQSNKTSKVMQANMQRTNKAVSNLTASIGALISVAAFTQLTRAVISTRKEFETFRAVLKNTLGSATAARKEFEKIQKFASETPFSVKTLTDAFVRLVNQGFKPTTEEMKKLGDLASSVGKDFIQLAEAIIDAQVGEFERLKEFGIKARVEGDKIKFTFKEIETTVDNTAASIREYILALGDVQGVSGAMAEIALTLEGRISNLGDAWDTFLDTLGGRTSGVMTSVIGFLSTMVEKATLFIDTVDPQLAATVAFEDFKKTLEGLDKEAQLESITDQVLVFRGSIETAREEIDKLNEQKTGKIRRFFSSGEQFMDQKRIDAFVESWEDWIVQLQIQEDLMIGLNKEIAAGTTTIEKQANEYINLGDTAQSTGGLIIASTEELDAVRIRSEEHVTNAFRVFTFNRLAAFRQEMKERKDLSEADMNAQLLAMDLMEARVFAISSGLQLIQAASKQNSELQQVAAISQAIINGALAITKIQAQAGVLAPPLMIAAALQTLAQIAVIRSQKFERGGYDVLKGRRHAQGGVDIGIGEAEEGEGIGVFSRQATRKYGKFLPAFVKAINENEATVTGYGDNAYNIHFDDSRQVGKLEAIRELLAKPEVTYQGRYKIITRNGHVTKVKI